MSSVPDELMTRLHQANERFRQARLQLDGSDNLERAKRTEIASELRAAEANLEQITKEIDGFLRTQQP